MERSIKSLTLIFLFSLIMPNILVAQPHQAWIHEYGSEGRDGLMDVYATVDGGYVMCGRSDEDGQVNRWTHPNLWIVKVDSRGEVTWEETYELFDGDQWSRGSTLIETDNGDFVIGGGTDVEDRDMRFIAIKVSADGEMIWENQYGGDLSGWCHAVIETKAGNYLLGGHRSPEGGGNPDCYAVMIDEDGGVVWETTFDQENGLDRIQAIREAPNDGFLLGGYLNRNFALIKIDVEGDEIWRETYPHERSSYCYSLVSTPDGFALGGSSFYWDERGNSQKQHRLVMVNRDGQIQLDRVYPEVNSGSARGLARMWDGGFTLVGWGSEDGGFAIRTQPGGDISWVTEDFPGPLYSVVVDADGSSLICGFSGYYRQGVLLKYFSERSAPLIIDFQPLELEFEILVGDTVQFRVQAEDAQEDTIRYLWTLEGDSVSEETFYTNIFEELGDFSVRCVAFDTTGADSVQWLVHVREFFIDSFSPDTLELTVQRRTDVDFALRVASIENLELDYLWTLTDRNQRRHEVGNTDSVTIRFDLTGDSRLEGVISSGEASDDVVWDIQVRSVVWWWWPHNNELTVPVDTTMEFEVFPFNDQSDSIAYRWELDGEFVDEEQLIDIRFREAGHRELIVCVTEGEEADTVRWAVNVQSDESTPDAEMKPNEFRLLSVNPNPFNSSTTVRYGLPYPGNVSLQVYNLSGQQVVTLFEGFRQKGIYTEHFSAGELPAGLYFLRLKAGKSILIRKVTLVK